MFPFFSNFCSIPSSRTPEKWWQQTPTYDNVVKWILQMVHLAFHKGSGRHSQISSQGDHRDRYILLWRGDELGGVYEMLVR